MSAAGHFKERKEAEGVSVMESSINSLTIGTPHFCSATCVPSISTWQAGGDRTHRQRMRQSVNVDGYRTSGQQPASLDPSKGPLGSQWAQGSLPRTPTSRAPRAGLHGLIT